MEAELKSVFNEYIANWPLVLGKVGIVMAFAVAMLYAALAVTRFNGLAKDSHEGKLDGRKLLLRDRVHLPYLITVVAMAAAQVIGMLPTIGRTNDEGIAAGLGWMAAEGAWVFVVVLASRWVVDWIVLPRISNLERLREGNFAVAIVEAAAYLSVGILLNGSLDGSAPTVRDGLLATLVFAVLGLLVVTVVVRLHERIASWRIEGSVRENIRRGELASGLEVAGMLIAVSLMVREGVAGDFTSWPVALAGFSVTVLFALATLYIARFVVDFLIIRGLKMTDILEGNLVGAAAVAAGFLVVTALPALVAIRTGL